MKYFKLTLLISLLIQFIFLYADEQVKSDNVITSQDKESVQVDLDAIKKRKDSKYKDAKIVGEKILSTLKNGESVKTGKARAVKKKKTAVKSATAKPDAVKKKAGPAKNTEKEKPQIIKSDKQIAKKEKKPVDKKNDSEKNKKTADKNIPVKGKNEIKQSKDTQSVEEKEEKSVTKTEEKTIIPSGNNKKNETITELTDTIIINPLPSDQTISRLYFMDYRGLAAWGKQRGLMIREDALPVVDGMSFFMPDYSAEFKLNGYDREKNYRLIIDFVKYSGNREPLNSLLKIWGRDVHGKLVLIAEVNENVLSKKKIFETLIPYELSSPGRFDIIVREYSDRPGRWGIWDMIVTAKRADQIETVRPDTSEKMKEIEPKIFK